jgi:hypothetical protein
MSAALNRLLTFAACTFSTVITTSIDQDSKTKNAEVDFMILSTSRTSHILYTA